MRRLLLASASGALRPIPLTHERSRFGRQAGCEIRVDEPGVPPRLGAIVFSLGDALALSEREDAPLIINGEACSRRLLFPGDEIAIGSCRLIYQSDEPSLGPLPADLLELAAFAEPRAPLANPTPVARARAEESAPRAPERSEDRDEKGVEPLAEPPLIASDAPAASLTEPEPPEPEADAWPERAWARLVGVAGAQKNACLWIERDLFVLSCSGSSAVITRRSGSVFLTPADGAAPMLNRARASLGPNPVEPLSLIGIGASVMRLELRA